MPKRGETGTNLTEFRKGRDESNLAEFPLSVLTDHVPEGLKTLEFEDTLDDWGTGQTITRRVCITGSDKFGLPTPKDEDVLLALLQFTKITNNFTSPEVHFTKRQMIELLGWDNRGWAYNRLEESLHRWKGVSIYYKSAWRDHKKRQWCDSEALGVIDYVRLTDSRRRPAKADGDHRSRVIWNKMLFDSFAAGYLKKLDYQAYRSLERPAARRAYRFLDKRFHHQLDWEFELRSFACEKIGLSRSYDTGQLKQRLQPALSELERIGFIAPVAYHKQRPKVWHVTISKAKAAVVDQDAHAALVPLESELVERGIGADGARALVANHSEERIREKLRLFDWLVARKDRRVSKNPPGFLTDAIRKNYPLPKDYREAATKRNKQASSQLKKPVVASHEPQPLSPEKQTLWDVFRGLPSETQQAIEEQAVTSASRIESDTYRRLQAKGGTLWEEFRQNMLLTFMSRNATLASNENSGTTEPVAEKSFTISHAS